MSLDLLVTSRLPSVYRPDAKETHTFAGSQGQPSCRSASLFLKYISIDLKQEQRKKHP